jgi:predicted alpha-1,6-mannanase (GH76 family)
MMLRFSPGGWLRLSGALTALVACTVGCNALGSGDHLAGQANATGGSGSSGGSPANGGNSADMMQNGGAVASGGAPTQVVFDANGLQVLGTPGDNLCRVSQDGQSLMVALKNAGTSALGAITVRVSTDLERYDSALSTPDLAAGDTTELAFARGPLVGFVDNWQFSISVDPDGKNGGPFPPIKGQCHDLRSRADAGMVRLAQWYNLDTGLWDQNGWWTSANQMTTVIDYSRETGSTDYVKEIENTYLKYQATNFDRFGYYDDDGWWALALIDAYDLTHVTKYLDMAKTIFTRMMGGWTDQCGGGIYWASGKAGADGMKNKNAIANELLMQVAAKLHTRTPGDTGAGSYLGWANKEWMWFKGSGLLGADNRVTDGLNDLVACKPTGPTFTYNQGTLLGALVDLSIAGGDPSLLDQALEIADATMLQMTDANGTLNEAACGGDTCTQFKGIFMRNLSNLYRVKPSAELSQFMRHQSDVLWSTNRDVQNEFGYQWQLPFDKASASRQSSALDALVAAVRSSNMNLSLGATATGSTSCTPTEVAANVLDGSSTSKWCAGGAGGQQLTIDLGSPLQVVGFRLRHAGAGGENTAWNTRDFEIATSTDGTSFTEDVRVTGNTDNITTHPIPATLARYARLNVTTAQADPMTLASRIYEFEVFGTGR